MHDEPFNLLGVPPEDWAKTSQTVRLAVLSLLDIVQAQSLQLKQLQAQVQELQVKVGQTSRTSSKPPSSDPPSAPPKPPRSSRGRKAGGHPGHLGQHRPLLPPEQVDEPIELLPEHCPNCLTAFALELPTLGDPQRTQVWELPVLLPHIIQYRQHTRCCPDCHHFVTAPLPPDAPPGAFGPRATALMAVLRGRYRLSLDDASEFLADVCNLPVSTASIVTSCERTSEALAPVDAAIQAVVQAAAIVNADETSWPTQTRKGWLWVAVCAIATCFRVHPSRSGAALRDLLGEAFRGVVGSDRYAAYNQLSDGQRQMCWAHLIRNLLGLHEHYGEQTGWAQQMVSLADDLFLLWHLYKEGRLDQVALQQALLPIRVAMRERLMEGVSSPYPKLASFSRDLLVHWEALWTFSRVEGVEPTNNAAERALRQAVLWRKGCFGSRSEAGCRFVERMMSVRATCVQQQRPLLAFVTEAVVAAWAGQPSPVLVQSSATV